MKREKAFLQKLQRGTRHDKPNEIVEDIDTNKSERRSVIDIGEMLACFCKMDSMTAYLGH